MVESKVKLNSFLGKLCRNKFARVLLEKIIPGLREQNQVKDKYSQLQKEYYEDSIISESDFIEKYDSSSDKHERIRNS